MGTDCVTYVVTYSTNSISRFIDLFNLADECNCKLPCYNPVTEIEMIQQGEYLWMLDGSLTPIQKQGIRNQQLYTPPKPFNLKYK